MFLQVCLLRCSPFRFSVEFCCIKFHQDMQSCGQGDQAGLGNTQLAVFALFVLVDKQITMHDISCLLCLDVHAISNTRGSHKQTLSLRFGVFAPNKCCCCFLLLPPGSFRFLLFCLQEQLLVFLLLRASCVLLFTSCFAALLLAWSICEEGKGLAASFN